MSSLVKYGLNLYADFTKHAPALNIRAGHQARELILKEGLQPEQVDIVPGAAGGPKGIGIQGLDQAILVNSFHALLSVEP